MNIDIVLWVIPFLIGVIINGSNREHLGRFEHLLRQRQSKLRQDFLCRRIQKPATALLFSIFDGNMQIPGFDKQYSAAFSCRLRQHTARRACSHDDDFIHIHPGPSFWFYFKTLQLFRYLFFKISPVALPQPKGYSPTQIRFHPGANVPKSVSPLK